MYRMLETRRSGGRGVRQSRGKNKAGAQQSYSPHGHPHATQHPVNNLKQHSELQQASEGRGAKVHINWDYTQNIRGYDVTV